MDLQYGWCVACKIQHISPRGSKLSKELLRRIKSLSCIAYLFIYLFQQTFIHCRKGLHDVCLLFFSNLLVDILTLTCICSCKEAAKWNHHCLNCSLSCSIRGTGGWVPYSRAPWQLLIRKVLVGHFLESTSVCMGFWGFSSFNCRHRQLCFLSYKSELKKITGAYVTEWKHCGMFSFVSQTPLISGKTALNWCVTCLDVRF